MTGENLQKIFDAYVSERMDTSVGLTIGGVSIPFEAFLISGGIFACIFALVCIYAFEADLMNVAAVSVVILMIFLAAGAILVGGTTSDKISPIEAEKKYLVFEQENLYPYLFDNKYTEDQLKRYEVDSFKLPSETQRSDMLSGTVHAYEKDLRKLMIDFDLSQLVIGKTAEDSSFILENKLDVTLNNDYPTGKPFYALYLTDKDYMALVEYFKMTVTLTSK